ncbi:MAG: TM2 domain-containing protein [Chitinophagaceae bacterium]|nr:MAG: TM2 domain-containing protein [Chitinophagaceae bacterium]
MTNMVQSAGLALTDASAANSAHALVSDAGGKSFAAALLLDLFLGGLGIHRLYLGTKTMTWVGYILTCGGIFGIVPLVDLVVLIVHNEDISPYVNNPKFFMWAGGNM